MLCYYYSQKYSGSIASPQVRANESPTKANNKQKAHKGREQTMQRKVSSNAL